MSAEDIYYLEEGIGGSSTPVYSVNPSEAWYAQTDSKIVRTNHYHKRAWRVESNAFVEWESTTREAPYPGGGTCDPTVGTVLYQWVTSNDPTLA
jgi:thiamine biosynthesis lipoprotein ApbE